MNSNFAKTSGLLTIAVGAGVLIGAAGVFLYEQIFKEKRRLILQQDVMKLDMSVSQLRRELEQLREVQKHRRKARRSRFGENVSSSMTESDVDMVSANDDDDEFFDFSDEEDLPDALNKVEWHDHDDLRYKGVDEKINHPELSVKLEALEELKELLEANENDPELLWRLAKVCHGISVIHGLGESKQLKKDFVDESVVYATRALENAPRSVEAHKWYAICIGSRAEFQPTKNKIKDGFVFKEHIEEALKLQPDDPTLLHLLGRFRFEVAGLSWVERKVAATIFGEVPFSTFPEALECLLKVEETNGNPWKENRLLIAKCYLNMGDSSDGLEWLDKAFDVEPHTLEETRLHQEIQRLLEKNEKHRKNK